MRGSNGQATKAFDVLSTKIWYMDVWLEQNVPFDGEAT